MDDLFKKPIKSVFFQYGGDTQLKLPSAPKLYELFPLNDDTKSKCHKTEKLEYTNEPASTASFSSASQPLPSAPPLDSLYDGLVDPEDPFGPEVKGFEFSERSIRHGFIRKVYAILSVQLAVTLVFILLIGQEGNTRQFITKYDFIFFRISLVLSVVTLIVLICSESIRRTPPLNFIFLGVFTIAEAFGVGMITLRFSTDNVILAVGLTTVICVALTLFTFQTKWDFTMMGGFLFVGAIVLMLFGILFMFMPGKRMVLVYSSIGALLFCGYLIYDTQMMMGGDRKDSISPEEYIFAAINIYLDIINILIYILRLIDSVEKKNEEGDE